MIKLLKKNRRTVQKFKEQKQLKKNRRNSDKEPETYILYQF